MKAKPKLIRVTTVPISLRILLKGQLRFMNDHFEVVAVSSSGSDLKEVSENEGVRVVPIEMTRTISPVKDLRSVWQLYKLFRKEKPLIVHTHTPKAGIAGMLAAKLAGVPHRLHTVAGMPLLEAEGKKRKLLDMVEKLTYGCATKVYPNSIGLLEIIRKNRYAPDRKLKVIGDGSSNGIDTSFFNPDAISEEQKQELRSALGISPEHFVFVFVGRLVSDKGINELVAAFQRIVSEFSNARLILVGPYESDLDPLKPETQTVIRDNPAIIEAGYQADVRPYFAISQCLAFPSYREGFPNVVLQAGAMGLSSIVSDINGCNEIVMDNQNGLIVPVKNAEALYQKMSYLCKNPLQERKLAASAREMITARYERSRIWSEMLNEYLDLK